MDPLTIVVASICMILLASIIVNFYFVYLHTDFSVITFTVVTQTNDTYTVEAEIQTQKNTEDNHQECSTQTILPIKNTATGTDYRVYQDLVVQATQPDYISLPEQLDEIIKHSHVTRQDIMRCIRWIIECKKTITVNSQAIINHTQQLTEI